MMSTDLPHHGALAEYDAFVVRLDGAIEQRCILQLGRADRSMRAPTTAVSTWRVLCVRRKKLRKHFGDASPQIVSSRLAGLK